MIIFIVRKHQIIGYYWMNGVSKAFTIHSTHATHKEAKAEVEKKNKKATNYTYTVGKVVLK